MSRKPVDQSEYRELMNAALNVVTGPTLGAYKSSAYEKRVARPRLKQLIKAIINQGAFNEEVTADLIARLDAIDAQEKKSAEWAAGEEQRRAERRAAVEAQRHPFEPHPGSPLLCRVCMGPSGANAHDTGPVN